MIGLHFVDTNADVVDALRKAFSAHRHDVTFAHGDIIEIAAGTAVSPANSQGFMDGGVDRAYATLFGRSVMRAVRDACLAQPEGHLPVGAAIAVPTRHERIRHLILAPTMFAPEHVPAANAYRALRAALKLVSGSPDLGRELYCPGLTTLVGGVAADLAASEMLAAYEDWKRAELAKLLTFTPPPGWARADVHGLISFAPADELAAAGGDLSGTHRAIAIGLRNVPGGTTAVDVIERLMKRRVAQGYPDRFSATIAGAEAQGFGWTDGVADVLSFFVPIGCVIVEFEATSLTMIGAPSLPGPVEAAGTLFGGVGWL